MTAGYYHPADGTILEAGSVFENLIESGRPFNYKSALGNSAVSLVVHVALITAAVFATLNAGEKIKEHVQAIAVTVQTKQEEKKEEPPPEQKIAQVNPPPKGFQTLSIPTNI